MRQSIAILLNVSGSERLAYAARLEIFLETRSAASALTRDATEISRTPADLRRAAESVASLVDEAISIVRTDLRPTIDCREGCSSCCRTPGVLVSIPELLRLLDYARRTFSTDEMSALRERAREYAALAQAVAEGGAPRPVPCPFLVEGRCAAYEARPLVCRGYNSTDVKACLRAEQERTEIVPIFAPLKDAADGASVGLSQALRRTGCNPALVDLGAALHLVTDGSAISDEALVSNKVDLTTIENGELLPALWSRVREIAAMLDIPTDDVS